MTTAPTKPHVQVAEIANDATAATRADIGAWRSFAVDLPLTVGAEMMHFASRRLQAQAEHLTALGRCGSLSEAFDLQTSFLGKVVSDYQKEVTHLTRDVKKAALAKAA